MSIRQEKENGMPVARIARRYGISRQSAYNVMNGVSGGGRERAPRASVLDPFKPYLRSRLARFDLPATVLLREIQRQGYGGGISVLKEFVAGVKTDLVRLVIERFETQPDVVGLDALADHLAHVCELAGGTRHVAIGSDLDGGYGTEQTPRDLDTIADLQKLAPLLRARVLGGRRRGRLARQLVPCAGHGPAGLRCRASAGPPSSSAGSSCWPARWAS